MRLVIVAAMLLAASAAMAADVWATKNYPPETVRNAVVLTAGIVEGGTDPTDQQIAAGIALLNSGEKTALHWEWTAIPGNICTKGDQCAVVGNAICEKNPNWTLGSAAVTPKLLTLACIFDCVANDPAEENYRETQLTLTIPCP